MKTKDELIAQIAILEGQKSFLKENDETLREEFSKALNAPKKYKQYSEDKMRVYTWHEIFRELGKLIAKRDYVEFQDHIDGMTNDINHIWKTIHEIQDNKK